LPFALTIIGASAGALLLIALATGRSWRSDPPLGDSIVQIEGRSIESYALPFWLLSDTRLAFLRSHGAFSREFTVRRRRSVLFQSRLHVLEEAFKEACMAVKVIMVQSPCDRPDLAAFLVRTQFTFGFLLAMVSLRVFLYRWGLR
jgi:hypothetical protein